MATWATRMLEAVRSFWRGPWNSGDPALANWFGYGPTASGESVTETTALNYSAVWAAVQCIAGSVGSLPLFVYKRRADGGKDRYLDSKLYRVLHDECNPEMSAMVARETLQGHVLLWGNAYAEIQRNEAGQVIALWPLEPHRVQPYRETPGAELRYRVARADGGQVTVSADRMFHLVGLSGDGTSGYSVVRRARESIGGGLATERFMNTFYGQGTSFSGVFEHPRALSDKAMQHLRESLERRATGAANAGKFLIAEEGMQWKPTSMPLRDAEFLATRRFQVEEIARWFNIPPDKLRDLSRATFSNIEAQAIDYVVNTLRPWLVRWEQECNRKLIAPLERRSQFVEHLVDGLLRGDTATRYQAYAAGRQWGWLCVDDIRAWENLNPLPNGEGQIFLVPTNMTPADRISEVIDAQIAPKALPAPPAPVEADDEADEADDRARVLEAVVADLRATVQPLQAKIEASSAAVVSELTGHLATDQALRAWQEATIRDIAKHFVRKELHFARQRIEAPDAPRTAAFYARLVTDFSADLRPWVLRIKADAALDARMTATLGQWADAAQASYTAALANGGLAAMVRTWEVDRAETLGRVLWEAIHA